MFELGLLILLLIIVLSIVISSIIIGISPMPSSKKVIFGFESLIEKTQYETVIDLGSGFGSLLLVLATRFPNKKFIGYERSFFPWLVSLVLKYLLNRKNVEFHRKDYLDIAFVDALYVCYLFPQGMELLHKKIITDDAKIELISSTFAFRTQECFKTVKLDDLYHTPLYYYKT